MAKKGKSRQVARKEQEKTAELSILDAPTEILTVRNAGEKAELVNSSSRRTSIQRKASYAPGANAVAGKAAMPNNSAAGNVVPSSIPSQMQVNTAGNGNPPRNNTLAIAALSFSGFLMIFVLLFCLIPLKRISYEVPVAYQDIETYTEMEPYLDAVYYLEKEPYTVTEAYSVSQPYITTEPYVVYHPRPWSPPPSSGNHTRPPRPPPEPVVSYREVTRYADVTKYRDVIQYKDVQKSRNELKYRPVQKQRTVARVRLETRYKTVPLLYYLMA